MKILILGSSGFLGKNLLDSLNISDANFFFFSHKKKKYKNINFINCDLVNQNEFEKNVCSIYPDVCIDLSWNGIPDYSEENNKLNLEIKKKNYSILVKHKCKKIISMGSCWEYGSYLGKIKEDIRLNKSLNDFAKTKIKVLDHLKYLSQTNAITYIWLRIFFVYGPYTKKTSLLHSIIDQYKKNKTVKLKNYNGSHDYIFVNDVISAIKLCAFRKLDSGIYNVGSGKSTSNLVFLEEFNKLVGISQNMFDKKGISLGNTLIANNKKLFEVVGWFPKFTISDGLSITLKKLGIYVE